MPRNWNIFISWVPFSLFLLIVLQKTLCFNYQGTDLFDTQGYPEMSRSNLKNVLIQAIRKGAPAYNAGRPEVCYQIYEKVAAGVISQGLALESEATVLSTALETAQNQDGNTAAWTMRRAFDLILEGKTQILNQSSTREPSIRDWQVMSFQQGIPTSPRWFSLNDGVMGGLSQSSLLHSSGSKCMIFAGEVSTARNGGFASVRSEPWSGWDFSGAKGIKLHIQGDGKLYKLNIKTDDAFDSVVYQKDFMALPNEWQEIKLDFEDFFPTIRGNVISPYPKLSGSQIRQIGFMLSKFTENGGLSKYFSPGSFQLNVRSIGAYY